MSVILIESVGCAMPRHTVLQSSLRSTEQRNHYEEVPAAKKKRLKHYAVTQQEAVQKLHTKRDNAGGAYKSFTLHLLKRVSRMRVRN